MNILPNDVNRTRKLGIDIESMKKQLIIAINEWLIPKDKEEELMKQIEDWVSKILINQSKPDVDWNTIKFILDLWE